MASGKAQKPILLRGMRFHTAAPFEKITARREANKAADLQNRGFQGIAALFRKGPSDLRRTSAL